ncbi:MAG: hypothetical protein M1396_02280 [Chloroflexi bacterium]|nr:hypothetical protein [Chloroflexota bacterium]
MAENCSPLQRQRDAKGEFFRLIAEQGHYGGRRFPTDTRQGYYVVTAGGTVLAAHNSRDPRYMEVQLRLALERWTQLHEAGTVQLALSIDNYVRAVPDRCATKGLVLRQYARDLPRKVDNRKDDWRKTAWNLDYVWFTAEEARALLPQRSSSIPHAAPERLVHRLARFHCRDFVRGEPPVWPHEAIQQALLKTQWRLWTAEGAIGELELSGRMHLSWIWKWQEGPTGIERAVDSGLDLALTGSATWSEVEQRFTRFDLVATGPRWGASQYNNRLDDLGPAPIGLVFQLAGNEPRDRTPPHGIGHPAYFA